MFAIAAAFSFVVVDLKYEWWIPQKSVLGKEMKNKK
jgi:hypothetical protein